MFQESLESNFTSVHPTVEFLDVAEHYSFNEDLHCKIKFNEYTPQEGDRVAIFKLGWSFVKDYLMFEWAPVSPKHQTSLVIFNRHILPKNSQELYQMCYISAENELHGASTPFQFSDPNIVLSKPLNTFRNITFTEQANFTDKDCEISKLKEENVILRESLKALVYQKSGSLYKNYDKDIQEVKELVESLKSMLSLHQKEIDTLKSKIREGGEEYRKLYLEKAKVEKKYEKLKSKKNSRKSSEECQEKSLEEKPINDFNFDIGDLKSMPPFPSILK